MYARELVGRSREPNPGPLSVSKRISQMPEILAD